MILAAGAFGAFLYHNHHRASEHIDAERQALEHLRSYAARPITSEAEKSGAYRYSWVKGSDLPPMAVAQPAQRDEASRWFATLGGHEDDEVFEFDLVLHRAPRNQPDLDGLRTFLSRPVEKRDEDARPFGWRKVRSGGG